MDRVMPFEQPTLPKTEMIRMLFDRKNQRLQVTNDRLECVRWNGDAWQHVPFLWSDCDFLIMTDVVSKIFGTTTAFLDVVSFGPVVQFTGWSATMLPKKTAIGYDEATGEIVVYPPDPTAGQVPKRFKVPFLRNRTDFQSWIIMVGKFAQLTPAPIPEDGVDKTIPRDVTMFCFI